MERWAGKLAVVTGASSGIGAAIAEALVHHGLQVVGLARREAQIQALSSTLANYPGKLHAYKADVTDTQQLHAALAWAVDTFGPIHILINNAGIARPTHLLDGTPEDFQDIINVNLLAVANASREAVQNMLKNDVDGHIVNINSIMGHYVPLVPFTNIYPASKHAVTAMTETLRQELFRLGKKIKISSVSPGYVVTEISSAFDQHEEVKKLKALAPYILPEDVANSVIHVLASPPTVHITELTVRPIGEPI